MKNKYFFFLFLVIALAASFIISLIFGGTPISFNELLTGLKSSTGIEYAIIWKIRIPRIMLSIFVGAGLAVSGCVLQGILRNPLAEPYTLGISGGAAFGVTVAVLLGIGSLGLPLLAFAGGLLSVFLVYLIASKKYFSVSTLILGGVILSFLFSSMVMLIFSIARTDKIHTTLLWLMGDLSGADTNLILICGLFIFFGILILFVFNREIDILTLGEEKAVFLGIDSAKTLKLLFVITSLITGACVAVSGIIGFVGLLIPHFIRNLTGPKYSTLIINSALAGAIFLCLADAIARTVIYPVELPVGVITGIAGGLFFIFYLLKSKEWEIF
ncbi:MAG: hypothetical protein A2252_12635 [Elusimicrobia bacterium RIFOXYA2_FULL_39_19]|nr:MAG: hypothetical protein A2252_12635 [Elusimicrobia bacterium RIFOXYA2_FULL_39_19]